MTASVKVTCTCGAIYEVIQTKGPSRDPDAFHMSLMSERTIRVGRG